LAGAGAKNLLWKLEFNSENAWKKIGKPFWESFVDQGKLAGVSVDSVDSGVSVVSVRLLITTS